LIRTAYGKYTGIDNGEEMQKKIVILCLLRCFIFQPAKLVAVDTDEALCEHNKARIDSLLKGKWAGLRRALARHVERAAAYFSIWTPEHYREVFSALGDHLPEIARDMQDIKPVYIKSNSAEYRTEKAELYGGKMVNMTYDVHYIVDTDGTWKIYRY
jgi:hypothetical protein